MPQTRRQIVNAQRRKASPSATPLEDLIVRGRGLPSNAVKLTAAERKLLSDPDWISEDEAGTIISRRIMRREATTAWRNLSLPFPGYLLRCPKPANGGRHACRAAQAFTAASISGKHARTGSATPHGSSSSVRSISAGLM